MTQKFIFLFSTFLFVSSTIPALAVDSTPSPKPTGQWYEFRKEVREEKNGLVKEIKEVRIEARNQIQINRDNAKATSTQTKKEYRQKRLKSVYDQIRSTMTRRFDYFVSLKAKLATKITEGEASGKNMSEAKAKIALFSDVNYKSALANFDAKYQEMVNSFTTDKPITSVSGLHESANRVRQEINILRKVLIDTLRLIITAK